MSTTNNTPEKQIAHELVKDRGREPIQGFAPDPSMSQEYTIGTSPDIDVTDWVAMRWSSKDGVTRVTRLLNENAVGLTDYAAVDVVPPDTTAVSFTGTAGTVVEIEGM